MPKRGGSLEGRQGDGAGGPAMGRAGHAFPPHLPACLPVGWPGQAGRREDCWWGGEGSLALPPASGQTFLVPSQFWTAPCLFPSAQACGETLGRPLTLPHYLPALEAAGCAKPSLRHYIYYAFKKETGGA